MGSIGDYLTKHHKDCDEIFARAEEAASSGNWATAERDCVRCTQCSHEFDARLEMMES